MAAKDQASGSPILPPSRFAPADSEGIAPSLPTIYGRGEHGGGRSTSRESAAWRLGVTREVADPKTETARCGQRHGQSDYSWNVRKYQGRFDSGSHEYGGGGGDAKRHS